MQVIPLQPVANQRVQIQLNGQPCTIDVAQMMYGLFVTLYVNGVLIIPTALAHNLNRIVRSVYLGFDGDLAFLDTQGDLDPVYTGFGGQTARFQFLYLTAAEIGTSG